MLANTQLQLHQQVSRRRYRKGDGRRCLGRQSVASAGHQRAAWPWGAHLSAELSLGARGRMQGGFGRPGCVSRPAEGAQDGLLFSLPGIMPLLVSCWGSPEALATRRAEAGCGWWGPPAASTRPSPHQCGKLK